MRLAACTIAIKYYGIHSVVGIFALGFAIAELLGIAEELFDKRG
jgi:hypothetical protein